MPPMKEEVHRTVVQEDGDCDRACCPVCSILLPKDMSLLDHLDSHPKLQVIEALIQLKDSCKDRNRHSPSQGKSSNVETSASSSVQSIVQSEQQGTDESDDEEAEEPNSLESLHLPVQPSVPSTSSNFLRLPDFIQVPVVASTGNKSPIPLPRSQAPVIFSPLMCSSGPSAVSGPDSLKSTSHLQFLAKSDFLRTSYSILKGRAVSVSPHVSLLPIPQSSGDEKPADSVDLIVLASKNPDFHEEEKFDAQSPIKRSGMEDKTASLPGKECTPLTCADQSDENNLLEVVLKDCDSQQKHLLSPKTKLSQVQESTLPLKVDVDDGLEPNSSQGRGATQEREMLLSPPRTRLCSDWNPLSSPGSHSNCSVEGSVRVRSDLSASPFSVSSPPSGVEERVQMWQATAKANSVQQSLNFPDAADYSKLSGCNDNGPINTNENSNFSHITQTVLKSSSESKQQFTNICDKVETDENSLESSPEFIVPDKQVQDDYLPSRPCSPPCDSGPPSPCHESPSTPLNIQTDETMPPRGELSEQESIGGNSSSMWSMPVYHTSRELPSPVVSYDLTARESWPGSDISDTEGNANLAPESHHPQRFTTTPTFSNTLHPFVQTNPPNDSFSGESPFSSLQPQVPLECNLGNNSSSKTDNSKAVSSKSSSNSSTSRVRKTPAKPRVYRCKQCSSEFKTLKLRKLHPCEQMISTSSETIASEVKREAPGSSSRDGESLVTKPKRKYTRKPKAIVKKEIILEDQSSGQANFGERFLVNKSDPESSESRTNAQLPTSESYQDSSVGAKSTDISFVEVTLKPEVPLQSFGNHECETCGQEFPNEKCLSQHNSSKHKGQKYQCAICGEIFFEKERGYLDHLMIHPLECQMCGKTFKRRKGLSLHMKWHMETKPCKCETCGKSFVTNQKLVEHQNTHTGNAPIKCAYCEETFKRYSNLIQHRNRHHLNTKRKVKDYICHCGEVYHSKKKLEWHKEIHEDKPKSCHFCSEKFVHTMSLTRHVRKAHDSRYVPKKERESENVECPVCHLVILKTSLPAHVKLHNSERPYSCHICGKDFSTKWNLQLHRWTHASRSSKPFKCTLCKAAFFRKQDFSNHMHSHRNVRPFTCNHCGCQFIRKYNCLRHMREHEKGKSYSCNICNKTFHRSYYLKDHLRVHSGARPFACHICGKASTSKSNHNTHVRIHHAREPQNTEV